MGRIFIRATEMEISRDIWREFLKTNMALIKTKQEIIVISIFIYCFIEIPRIGFNVENIKKNPSKYVHKLIGILYKKNKTVKIL